MEVLGAASVVDMVLDLVLAVVLPVLMVAANTVEAARTKIVAVLEAKA